MNKKTQNSIIVIFFVSIIVFLFTSTILKMPPILINILNESSDSDTKKITQKIENAYREIINKRNDLVDIYGFSQNLLNKKIIGNMDFYKDNNGVMQVFNLDDEYKNFYTRMLELKNTADSRNIPIMYVQAPSRVIDNYTETPEGFVNNENHNMDVLVDSLEKSSIPVIDYRKYISESGDKNTIAPQNVFFKTDLHMTTESELNLLNIVTEKLETEFDIKFENKEQVLNKDNYKIKSYDFLGNYSRSSGRYFTDIDTFNIYHPKFDTDLQLMDENNMLLRQGNFESVVMNGYENSSNINKYIYWVVNFAQYQKPCYEYVNLKNENAPRIMIVMDSLGLRMASYMVGVCSNLTIVDPRFDVGGDCLSEKLMYRDYDAIVVLQEISLKNSLLVKNSLRNANAEIVSHNAPVYIKRDKSYTIDITVKNTGEDTWSKEQDVKLCILQDGNDYGYRININDGEYIEAGEKYTFHLNGFVAPPENSTFIEFQMVQDGVQWFGEKEKVDIKILE